MATLTIKRNDLSRRIEDTLAFDGVAIDLSNAVAVNFIMSYAGDVVINNPASVIDPVNGRVAYTFYEGETATAGVFQFEWEIEFAEGKKLTVPDDGYHTLNILLDLA